MDFYSALFQNCGDAIVIADQHYQIVFENPKAREILGGHQALLLDPPAALSTVLYEVDAESDTREIAAPLRWAVEGGQFSDREFLLQSDHLTGDLWLSITGFPLQLPEFSFQGAMLIIRDISRHKAIVHQRLKALFRDELTGLVNRTVFMDRVQHACTRLLRNDNRLMAILCLDIRRLKTVNDTLGYLAGDQLLVAFADRISHMLRPEDTLSRLGGDEFTVLMEDVSSLVEVITVAEAIHEACQRSFKIQDHDIHIAVSIGISLANGPGHNAETLLRQADIARYRVKQAFGERYCVFEDSMKADADDSLYLEMALKKALERQEMFLEYQPIFLVRTQAVIGLESLVRWRHPEQGVLSPGRFISLAEKTGLIIPLGWWILEESCRQLKAWQETIPFARSLFVSVNMSSKQFTQKDVPQRIQQILNTVGLESRCLKIEITESVLIDNSTTIVDTLQAIRALGIKLSIDDFGTGYSSLSYLHRFPFDTLKIDRSFIENADADFEKLEILQSVVRLAWNLGLEVVAEGIETPKHFAQIKALRCESGQGFLFSKPLSTEAMQQLIWEQATQPPEA